MTNTLRLHQHEVPRVVKFTETEGRVQGLGNVGSCLVGVEFVLQN